MTAAPRSLRMTLKRNGEPCSMTFTEVTRDWWISDCKRYSIAVAHHTAKPYMAYLRPSHTAPDKDGFRPMATDLGAYEHMEGRDGAIAACIRHKRANPISATTTQQAAAAQELST